MDFKGLIPALESGEIDVIIAGMSPTAERALTINFSQEYYRSEQVMVARANGDYAQATTLNDFTGARIAAQIGTLQESLMNQINQASKQSLNDYPSLGLALSTNAIDGFIAELPVAQGMAATNSNFKIIRFAANQGFTVSDEDIIVSVGLRKADEDLLSKVNAALALISSETRNQMMEAALARQPKEA